MNHITYHYNFYVIVSFQECCPSVSVYNSYQVYFMRDALKEMLSISIDTRTKKH